MPCPTKVRRLVSSKPRRSGASSGNADIITPYSLPGTAFPATERETPYSAHPCYAVYPLARLGGDQEPLLETPGRDVWCPDTASESTKEEGTASAARLQGRGNQRRIRCVPFYPAIDERKRRLSLGNRWKSSTSSPPVRVGDWTGEIGQKAFQDCPSFPSEKVCPARTLWMSNGLDAAGIEGCHSSCSLSFCEGVARELGQRLTTSRGCHVPKPAAFRRTTCLSHTIGQNSPTPVEKIPAFVSTGKIAAVNVAVLSQRENLPNYTSGYPRAVPFATHSPRRGIPAATG